MALALTVDELHAFLSEAFDTERPYEVTHLAEGEARLRLPVDRIMLRPGGTVAGPTLMHLADAAAYALILAHIGRVALAVTSSLHIAFLRRPPPGDVVAEARFLKLGRTLAVVDVHLGSGDVPLVAQATVTYAIPRDAEAVGAGPAPAG